MIEGPVRDFCESSLQQDLFFVRYLCNCIEAGRGKAPIGHRFFTEVWMLMDSGEYYLDGMAIHKTKEDDLTMVRNQKIGFIFQNYQLIPTYNVMQNIIMPLLMRGMTHEEAEEKCKNTIKLLGLDHRIGHKPNELSGGQKQRVSIARALVGQPAILLADEPTGALDQTSGKEVLKLFRELNDMGNTIVMITHDLGVAQSAKRIVRIVDGQLQE